MPLIETIPYENSTGELREIYDDIIRSRGKLAGVHRIQSLNPSTIVAHMELYMSILFARSPLTRAQREMMAVIVSQCNRCDYCIGHHAAALHHFWKDSKRIESLKTNFREAALSLQDETLCRFAGQLTMNDKSVNHEKQVGMLKEAGFSDRAILDATLVVAYFNLLTASRWRSVCKPVKAKRWRATSMIE